MKIKILDHLIPGYTEKFLAGQYGSEEMPLLKAIGNKYIDEVKKFDLKNIYIVACQHILEPQLEMFKLFIQAGIEACHIIILPKVYSANIEIIAELKNIGCLVVDEALQFESNESFDNFHQRQTKILSAFVMNYVPTTGQIIILDDGGMLIQSFAQMIDSEHDRQLYGVEQTASGKNKLLTKNLPFIVTSVASSIEKIEIETDYIIRLAMVRIKEYFAIHNISSTAKILILGQGPIGLTLIKALRKEGFDCSAYDLSDGQNPHCLSDYDVIIGASGANSVNTDQLSILKEGCHLISVSSSDREFPAVFIRKNTDSGKDIHDTFIYRFHKVYLANGGFPITFKGNRSECFPLEMDVTMMKLSEAVFHHIIKRTDLKASVNDLYWWKKISLLKKSIFLSIILLIGVLIFKLMFYGWTMAPLYLQLTIIAILISCSIPAIWSIYFYKKLESYLHKKA